LESFWSQLCAVKGGICRYRHYPTHMKDNIGRAILSETQLHFFNLRVVIA